MSRLAIKVDVDTDRGTRDGVWPLAVLCRRYRVPAVFLFSLGPDRMGRSVWRVFQPGFLRKVWRTRVVSNYGLSTLLRGTLLPARDLGRRYADLMRRVRDEGFEVGVHAYDHYRWQNHLGRMSLPEVRAEFGQARAEFERVFGEKPTVAGAAGWQCSPHSLAVYDEADLLYASDTRGHTPFRPVMHGQAFQTPQLPTTLPTLDELLGRPEFPLERLADHYLERLRPPADQVLTVHAELEGLRFRAIFEDLLRRALRAGVEFYSLRQAAERLRRCGLERLSACEINLRSIEGRSATVAVQRELGSVLEK